MGPQATRKLRHDGQDSVQGTIQRFSSRTACCVVKRLRRRLGLSRAPGPLLSGSETFVRARFLLLCLLKFGIEPDRFENTQVELRETQQIGRAACRERVCMYV